MPAGALPGAHALLARIRARWRRHALARGLLLAVATLAGTAVVVVLLDQAASLPVSARALLRLLPPTAATAILIGAGIRLWRAPSAARLALFAEERMPALAGYLSTALSWREDGAVARAFRSRAARVIDGVAGQRIEMPPLRREALLFVAAVGVLLLLVVPIGGAELWRRWAELAPGPSPSIAPRLGEAGRAAAVARESAFEDLRVRVAPPAYTALPAGDVSAAEPIAAVAGSIVEISGTMPSGAARIEAKAIAADANGGADGLAVTIDGRRWSTRWRVSATQRGVDLQALGDAGSADVRARRVLAARIVTDREPRVQLDEPTQDFVLASAAGSVRFHASAADDFGISDLRLHWILSRGGGESFTFTEGEWPLSARASGTAARGAHIVDLAALGLGPGDVLHVRAVAHDGNDVTGPGIGVSATRLLRVARADEMADVSTLIGFPIEAEKEPILSQRMIILLTERLIANAPKLDAAARLRESASIAREQARLREHVADVIFAGESGGAGSHEEQEEPPARAAPTTAADSARRMQELLEAAARATGSGTLEELGHSHDPDPALAVNRPLLAAFNAMYDAERALRLGEPRGALPHEYRALEILQALREAERVFLRGRQAVAPIDIAAARGTGKLEDAEPAARSPASPAPSAAAHAETIGELAGRLVRLAAREAGLALSSLAAQLLADPAADARVGALLTRAAEAAVAGRPDDARALALQARTILAPGAAVASAPRLAAPAGDAEAAYLSRIGTAAPATPVARAVDDVRPFAFATVRYESGDWDSGQLVPANLIHSIALYTDVPVAPEGVIVDLASDEIFRHPLLYMTGHLPVRFSAAEAAHLKAYVERGGLIFIDDHNHDIDGAFHRTVTAELKRIFGDDSLRELPNDHELYRAFFTFPDGPPTTSHELNGWGDGLIHEHLLAVQQDSRIGVLYSNKDYSSEWSYHVQNKRFQALDNTRFGVNLLVYALTR